MAEPAKQIVNEAVCGRRIVLSGHVQGVGFRPFVYRLANELGLTGQVRNQLGQVEILANGLPEALDRFARDLIEKAPPLARPQLDESESNGTAVFDDFSIVESSSAANAKIFVPPDYFMCDDCRDELFDPGDRRYRYPFINCTQCGPRYTLIESLPYDRPNTSMSGFPMCADCSEEYLDPANRRFHAEPVACPVCGPQLTFVDTERDLTSIRDEALATALDRLREGKILAVKGIGGYHLMCDAQNFAAVTALRQRKFRPDKPLAVMFPITGEDGLDAVRLYAELNDAEAGLLTSPGRPIVLVRKLDDAGLAVNIAAGLGEIGAFLPYSPLHQLLLEGFGGPLVATSANISGEPVLTGNDDVESRLGNVADAFLHHNRPIARPADDPVFRCIDGKTRPMRIGRGCAPLELQLPGTLEQPILAVGGHMKGTVALAWDDRVVVSPHIGEMDSPRSLAVFEQVAQDLQSLYSVKAEAIVCDAHAGYTTHRWARQQAMPVETVWHHQAHASAVAGEFALPGQWLVFAWDGVGLGEDETLWGGEAFLGRAGDWRRAGSLRPFRLPGGDKAGREPWRSAAALHWTCDRSWPDSPDTDGLARAAWLRAMNSPETSAAGRLFDAAAALIGKFHFASFEAQGPMYLEALVQEEGIVVDLPLAMDDGGVWRTDWAPLLGIIGDTNRSQRSRAELFHSTMAHALLEQARALRDFTSIEQVGLCGGVFQNRVLTEQSVALLANDGFRVCVPEVLPVNDAALSFGQAAEFAARKGTN